MRRTGRLLLAVAVALGFVSVLAIASGWHWAVSGVDSLLATPTATPTPVVLPTAAPDTDTAEAIALAVVPPRDSRTLAEHLRPANGSIPVIVNPDTPHHWVGQKARFQVSNSDTLQVFPITATLRLISEHATIWVQDGLRVDQKALLRTAQNFDERIYPAVHRYFGSEWKPGVDNDPRITILNARFSGAAAYYSSNDEFSHLVYPYSNEREILYMSDNSASPGTDYYEGILAHEFQHMVHWHLDSNEEAWVNEGAAELSTRLCGYGVTPALYSFAREPDTQLTAWTLSPDEDTLPHYGASYLWLDYFRQRLGAEALKAVIAEPANGIEGFEAVLRKTPNAPSFDDLFADWTVANLLDNMSVQGGRYGHQFADLHERVEATYRDFPVHKAGTVHQYGTDYIALVPNKKAIKIDFSGFPKADVVPNTPYEGRYEWWANRGDMSDTRLTRSFDLRGLKKATLQYALWYQLEDGWDYGYIEVSTDEGATWSPLSTDHTTTYDPNGNAFGPGYTGFSGHTAGSTSRLEAEWVQEEVDLTPYAGERILVRFEQITDDAVNLPGMCIDNISVPELQFRDGAETEVEGWQAEGFVRIDNELPQRFLVQVILEGKEPRVERLRLDEQQHGALIVDGYERATLAISGLTRHTTEMANYSYSVTPVDR